MKRFPEIGITCTWLRILVHQSKMVSMKGTRCLETSEMYFHDFLKRYKTDYVDVLFLHNSDGEDDYHEVMKPGGLYEMAIEFKKTGQSKGLLPSAAIQPRPP